MNPLQRKASLSLIVTLTILWGRMAAAQAVWRIARLQQSCPNLHLPLEIDAGCFELRGHDSLDEPGNVLPVVYAHS